MGSSGTIGQTVIQVSDVLEACIRRCGGEVSDLNPEVNQILKNNLFYVLSNMSNRGVNLWRVYRPLFPLYLGQAEYRLNVGDVDILKLMYRQPIRLAPASIISSDGATTTAFLSDGLTGTACAQSVPNGNFVFDWGVGVTQQVALIGLLSAVAASYTLIFETSPDGVTWTPLLAPSVTAYAAQGWNWYAFEPAGPATEFFRVRETGGATLNFAEISVAAQWNDVEISRINRDQYMQYPNKRIPGPPRQYWFDRQLTPVAVTWPVPNNTFNLLAPLVHRHIEDVGSLSNSLNIPQRWQQAIITYASFMAFLELPKGIVDMNRYPLLKEEALAISLPDAEGEERDNSAVEIVPGINVYTR